MHRQELTKKNRSQVIHAYVKETLDVADWNVAKMNVAKMKQHLQLLKGKQNITEILKGLETEDEITGEIEQADF